MARLREFDEKTALAAVADVFWEKGYEATSYADLTSVTGLGKGSLYAAFGNKEALYKSALEFYVAKEIGPLGAMLLKGFEENPGSWRTRLLSFLNVAIDAVETRQDRRGCFICSAAIERAPFDPLVEEVVLDTFEMVKEILQQVLANQVKESQRVALAEHLLTTYLGMRVMVKAGVGTKQLTLIRDKALEGL